MAGRSKDSNVNVPLPPFVQALRLAAMATPTRGIRSILEYALITALPDALTIRSGDSEVNVELTIPCANDLKEPWQFLLPPATAHAALVDLRDETVAIEQDGPVVVVRGSGAKDVFRFKQSDPKTYPGDVKANYKEPATVPVKDFLAAVRHVKASTGLGEPQRYVTTGALLHLDGEEGALVGTDCASMAVSRIACKARPMAKDAAPVIVPKRALDLIVKVLGPAEGEMSVRVAPNAAEFKTANATFATGLLAGNFPAWKKFEAGCLADTDAVEFDRAALLSAIKRVSAPMDLDYQPVRFEFTGSTLSLKGSHESIGEFETELEAPGMPASKARIDVSYLTLALPLVGTDKITYRRNRNNGYVSILSEDGKFSYFLSPLIER